MTPSDLELLQRFARDHAQDAFTELVQRHLNLVYSAALRQVRSPQLAEEIAQSVFADLARVAATPSSPFGEVGRDASSPVNLTAWLFTVTRHTAVDVIRKESRRQLREQLAYEMNITNAPDASWQHIEPLLDEAVAELDEADRAAVLLRFFENQSLRDVGQQLGVSDDAAQKRVSRALERLREFFAKRGISVGAGGLVVVISANAVQAAPVGLAVTISTAALAGTAATTSTLIAATTKTIAMTTLQKTLVTATVAVLAGAGIYEARQAARLRDQVQTLQQQQAPLAEQIQKLQNGFADATNRLADLLAENARIKRNPNQTELLKLRGQVTRLQNELADQSNAAAKDLVSRMEKLKQLLEKNPAAIIPELQLLDENDWLIAGRNSNLDTEDTSRQALSGIREMAEQKFANKLRNALNKFAQANGQSFPSDLSQLQSYFDASVDESIFQRWEILPAGAELAGIGNKGPFITQKAPVDELLDRRWAVGTWGSACTDFLNSEIQDTLMPVYKAYSAANNGSYPDNPAQFVPYATSATQQAALQKLIQQYAIRH